MEIKRHGGSLRQQRRGRVEARRHWKVSITVLAVDSRETVSEKVKVFPILDRVAQASSVVVSEPVRWQVPRFTIPRV